MKQYVGYIYVYVNKLDGRKYVGQTIDIKQRHNAHLYKKTNTYFDNSLQKLGMEYFELHILEVFCCSDRATQKKRLDEREIFWIKELKTYWYDYPDSGYNLNKGGSTKLGYRKPGAKLYAADFETKEEFEKARYQIRKEWTRIYRETHKEYFRQKAKRYRDKNKDRINEQRRANYRKNPKIKTEEQKQKDRESARRYRARKKELLSLKKDES